MPAETRHFDTTQLNGHSRGFLNGAGRHRRPRDRSSTLRTGSQVDMVTLRPAARVDTSFPAALPVFAAHCQGKRTAAACPSGSSAAPCAHVNVAQPQHETARRPATRSRSNLNQVEPADGDGKGAEEQPQDAFRHN